MNLGVLFSGGKDSCLAYYKALEHNRISCLVTIFSGNPQSYMFHVPNARLAEKQAQAIGVPLTSQTTAGVPEKELEDLEKAIQLAVDTYQIEGVVSGAIRSMYQSIRVKMVCERLGLASLNPLWMKDEVELLHEIVSLGFKVIISGVFAYPLDVTYLGKEIDENLIGRLMKLREDYGISIAGEGGEIETTVLDAPFFKKSIRILNHRISYSNNSGVYEITEAELHDK